MAIDYRRIHSLTARELMAPHAGGDTFSVKTLQTIIERQACWTEDDLRRLNLLPY